MKRFSEKAKKRRLDESFSLGVYKANYITFLAENVTYHFDFVHAHGNLQREKSDLIEDWCSNDALKQSHHSTKEMFFVKIMSWRKNSVGVCNVLCWEKPTEFFHQPINSARDEASKAFS